MPPIKVFTLGKTGVVIDPHSLDPTVPADALTLAQNAQPDPTAAHQGALRKRPGFAKFNPISAGGVILGGIGMPVAGTGGAPGSGGGAPVGTGDPDGPNPGGGDGTGGPGGTFDDEPRAVPNPGPGYFSPGASRRVVIVPRFGSDAAAQSGGAGFYVSDKEFLASATDVHTSIPASPYSFPGAAPFNDLWGTAGCVVDGKLYYAATRGSQLASGSQTIHVNDGATDAILCTIPENPLDVAYANYPTLTGGKRQAVVCMHAGSDGNIYIGVKDKYYGQATNDSVGRVYKLVPSTGALTAIPLTVTNLMIPYCVAYFDGHVFWGEFLPQSAVNQKPAIYATSSDGSYSALDWGGSAVNANVASMYSAMCVWKNTLVVGNGSNQNTSGTGDGSYLAQLYFRFAGGSLGDVTNWNGFSWDTARTGFDTFGNVVTSIAVFNGDLYVAWYSPGNATYIYKLTQADDEITLANFNVLATKVFNNLATFPYNLFVDDGVLYAIGVKEGSTSCSAYSTTDGTTWTSRTAKFSDLGHSDRIRPSFLFGVNP